MVFRGIIGWLRGRKKEDETEEEDPQVVLAKRILRMDMERDMLNDRNYKPKKHLRKRRRITYIPPTEYGKKCINEKHIFSKSINGKKVALRVLYISQFSPKYFICGKCKGAYRGIHYAGKIEKWFFLCTKCFSTYPNYADTKIELREDQRQYLSDILKDSKNQWG